MYEQVLKYDELGQDSVKALYQISKLRVAQKDFYEAYYTLQRANKIQFSSPKINNYRNLIEGVSTNNII